MPTITDLDGFEHKVTTANATATMDPKLWDIVANTGQISFVAGYNNEGSAVRIAANGANTRLQRNYFTAGTLKVISFYIKVISLPSARSRVFASVADIHGLIQLDTDGTLDASVAGGGVVAGPSVNDGAWHRVDLRYDSNPATHTLDWQVDGSAQTQATGAGVAASNQTAFYVGTNQAETFTVDIDSLVVSATTGDYPIGAHHVFAVVPDADGTHNAGTNIMERASDGADIGAVTAWDLLDEWPPTTGLNNADTVTSSASGSTNYAEVTFQNFPGWASSTLWAVQAIVAHQSDTTGANTGISRIVDSAGTTLTDIFSGDMSETSAHYTRRIITAPGGGWTSTNFNGVKGRVGFGTLQPGAPEWLALMLQAATPDTPPAPAVVSRPPALDRFYQSTLLRM